MKQLFILTLFSLSAVAMHGQSRMGVDSTFGNNGYVQYGPASWEGLGAMLQADGKMVIYGNDPALSTQYFDKDLRMTRLNADGSIDSSFNQTGTVYQHGAFGHYFIATKGVLLPNGKILIAGESIPVDGGKHRSTVGRYNADGSVDSMFGNNGWVRQEFDSLWASTSDMIVSEDSKILLLVRAEYFSTTEDIIKSYLYQLDEDGQLDPDFGANGIQEVTDTAYFYLSKLALASTGVISVLGTQYDNQGFPHSALYTFEPDGSLDSNFVITIPITLPNYYYLGFSTILVQPDDKILLGGSTFPNPLLLRLNPDGTFDKSFNRDGLAVQGAYTDQFQHMRNLSLLENGKMLVDYGGFSMGLYNKNGTSDYSFNLDGLYEGPRLSEWTEESYAKSFALLPLPNDKIVHVAVSNKKLYVTRYEQKACAQ